MKLKVNLEKHLNDFSLKTDFQVGNDTFGILGASGSGKSITLRCIAGLTTPTKGKIILNDRVLFDSEKGINLPARKRQIGYLFQNYALFPHLTVEENIAFGIADLPKREQKSRIDEKLEMIQLTDLRNRYPYQLSGGQQQRVALARALVTNPEALLLDEPFSALDNHLRRHMEKELIEILRNYNGVTLFVTHHLEEAYRVCNQIMIMDNGRVIANDKRDAIFLEPPTFMAAKLTGCKNISRAKIDEKVQALEWGSIMLTIHQKKPSSITEMYVGIRAHHIKFVSKEESNMVNVFPCSIISTEEGPHLITVMISINNGDTSGQLQVEVFKEDWNKIYKEHKEVFVYLPPERLFVASS